MKGAAIFTTAVFLPLTGTVSRYALIEPGRTSYHTLFEAIPAELRTQFYASIQRGSPFLMPVTGAAQRVRSIRLKSLCGTSLCP